LTREENERMCRVGPGTAMGVAMRRYWLPALASDELPEPDCPPVHVQLLGQDFVAFRDSEGRVGFMNELCCHRGASLVLGRVEDCGIRCIYHGWLFGVDGTIKETPNLANPNFRERVKAPAYVVREVAGIVWVFLGEPGSEPPFPHYRFMDVDDDHRTAVPVVVNCNYVQIIEGFIDSSHLNYLHADSLGLAAGPSDAAPDHRKGALNSIGTDQMPRLEVESTEFGFQYAALRKIGDDREHVRITAFIAPFTGYIAPDGGCLFAVPMTDERTLFMNVFWSDDVALGTDPDRSKHLGFLGLDQEVRDRLGMSRATCDSPTAAGRTNNFYQDRAAMADGRSFSGIHNFTPEDAAVCISMGPIYDRSSGDEHVVPADAAVVRMRRLLLHCADVAEKGGDPVALDLDLGSVRANAGDIDADQRWQDLVPGNNRVESW
jgi:phthalate 4,5-dioxygenase oxygenase subunit